MSLQIFRGPVEPSTNRNPPTSRSKRSQHSDLEANTLGQFIPLHYHYNMLQDDRRVNAFRAAIETVVKPGMHVLELGGGTGILSSFAARLGATVTCVERNPELVACAVRLMELNDLGSLVTVVQKDAIEFIPSRPVDVVVCEMLHVGLLREKQMHVIDSFKQNYIEHIGDSLPRFLPEASLLTFQAIDFPFDFAGYYAPIPLFQSPNIDSAKTRELSRLVRYATVVYDEPCQEELSWSGPIRIEETGTMSALRFITQNLIAIDTQTQSSIDWPNQFLILPLASPILVEEGDEVGIEFSYRAGASLDSLSNSIRIKIRKDVPLRKAG